MAFDLREEALRGLVALRDILDRLIGESAVREHNETPPFPVDILEGEDRYVVQASLPGVKPEDLVIQAQGNLVHIRGERRLREGQQWLLREHQSMEFSRFLTLPCVVEADRAFARFEHGLLTLELPKLAAVKIIPLSDALPAELQVEAAEAGQDQAPTEDIARAETIAEEALEEQSEATLDESTIAESEVGTDLPAEEQIETTEEAFASEAVEATEAGNTTEMPQEVILEEALAEEISLAAEAIAEAGEFAEGIEVAEISVAAESGDALAEIAVAEELSTSEIVAVAEEILAEAAGESAINLPESEVATAEIVAETVEENR